MSRTLSINSGSQRTINCRNQLCYGGGLNLDYVMRWSVVEAKLTEFEHIYSCQGYEGLAERPQEVRRL